MPWKVPAAQGEQADAPTPEYLPALHATQTEESVAPVSADTVPAPQRVHVDAPIATSYWPAAQFAQAVALAAAA